MKVLYVRVTDEAHAYIAAMAARSGLAMTTITVLLLDEARRRGWQVQTSGARVTDAVDSPAASSPRSPAAGSGPGSPLAIPPLAIPGEPGPLHAGCHLPFHAIGCPDWQAS